MTHRPSPPPHHAARALPVLHAALLSGALLLSGCTVDLQNRQASRELAQQAAPGSVYTGWRMFQVRCARCHGEQATGSATAPDLVVQVRTMGPRQFAAAVLNRYEWPLADPPAGSGPAAREAWIDQILQRQAGALSMPVWQGEPMVTAHVIDLYAYLSARADGTQGPGRPNP